MEALYSSATHNCFTYSLGVYFLVKKGSDANITIHPDYGKVPNGTKIIAIKSLSGKADLIGLQIEDTTGANSYILYQDGRAVYCRREQ